MFFRNVLTLLSAITFCGLLVAQTPTPIHAYELNNSLADTYGGPALTNNGASLGATGLSFGINQGPSLDSWLGGSATSGNYSIEMYFYLSNTSSYRKLIDFQNRTSDGGLYNLNTSLNYYPITTGPASSITDSVFVHLVLTRDGGTNDVVGYINGSAALGISFNDGSNNAVFGAANNVIHFFQDDTTTTNEASAGFVDFIRVYDHAVSSSEAAALFTAVPEPTTYLTIGTALLGAGMIAARRRRRLRRSKAAKKPSSEA